MMTPWLRPTLVSAGLGVLALLLLALGCAEDTCTAGDRCERACNTGECGICVAAGLCSCVTCPSDSGDGDVRRDGGIRNEAGVVIEDEPCQFGPSPGDLVINEVAIKGSGEAEFVEIVNVTNHSINLDRAEIHSHPSSPGSEEDVSRRMFFEGGCLAPYGVVVVQGGRSPWLWNPAALAPDKKDGAVASLSLPDSPSNGIWRIEVRSPDGEIISLFSGERALINAAGSITRSPDIDGPPARHDTVPPGLVNSPGTCSDGEAFSEGRCRVSGPPPDAGPGRDGGPDAGTIVDGEVPPGCAPPSPGELTLNEVLIRGTEFVELVNRTDRALSLAGLWLEAPMGNGTPSKRFTLTDGCLAPRGAVAIYGGNAPWVWEPAAAVPASQDGSLNYSLVDSPAADPVVMRLLDAQDNEIDRLTAEKALIHASSSITRSPDLDSNTPPQRHRDVAPGNEDTSPARCINGGTFAADCMDGPNIPPPPPPPPGCEPATPGSLVVNEILVRGTEFIEVVNNTDAAVSLAGIRMTSPTGGGAESNRFTLTDGCLAPRGAVAIYTNRQPWTWDPAAEQAATQDGDISYSLVDNPGLDPMYVRLYGAGDVLIHEALMAKALIHATSSATRSPDLTGDFALHRDVAEGGADTSPARCLNGRRFEDRCQ